MYRQNDKMRTRLASLGFAMALEPVPNLKEYDLDAMNDEGGINGDYYGTSGTSLRKTTSSHTAGRSAHTSGDVATAPSSPFLQRPLKRQRVDSPLPNNMQIEPPSSRDAMPPPQKPVSGMRSVRKIFPTLRKKFSGGRPTQGPQYISRTNYDPHMDGDSQWNGSKYGSVMDSQVSIHQDDTRSESPYMSGALPVEQFSNGANSRPSKMLSSMGVNNDGPEFTFSAPSPAKMASRGDGHHPVQLPTEPSYIRLMDGLSGDVGVELGLKDPRAGDSDIHRTSDWSGQVNSYTQDPRDHGRIEDQENWRRGPPSHHPPSLGKLLSADNRLETVQRNRTDHHHDRTFQELAHNPTTPAPRRYQQHGHQIENVVSPYAESGNRNTGHFSRPRIAETKDSSNHSGAYQSRRPRMIAPERNWREPRGLNGLSFFDSPVISGHQYSQRDQERTQISRSPPSRQWQSRNLTSGGFITRPDAEQSPSFRDSAYGSSRNRPIDTKEQHMQSSSASPFPSFSRSSYSRPGQLLSTMPSIVSGRSPVRTRPQWDALQRIGVRSSRHEFTKNTANSYAAPSRNTFSSAGRRSVRR
jgi:hypothetical protein